MKKAKTKRRYIWEGIIFCEVGACLLGYFVLALLNKSEYLLVVYPLMGPFLYWGFEKEWETKYGKPDDSHPLIDWVRFGQLIQKYAGVKKP